MLGLAGGVTGIFLLADLSHEIIEHSLVRIIDQHEILRCIAVGHPPVTRSLDLGLAQIIELLAHMRESIPLYLRGIGLKHSLGRLDERLLGGCYPWFFYTLFFDSGRHLFLHFGLRVGGFSRCGSICDNGIGISLR